MNKIRLKSRRIEMGYTLQDVADKMNVTRSTIQKYESGIIKGIEASVLERLAAVLECTPSYLMGWDEKNKSQTIGEKIRTLRIEKGITQEQLAISANTIKQTIHKYELGIITNIPASKVKAIADRLGTTPAYLMGWNEDEMPTQREESIVDIITHLRKDDKFLSLVETLHSFPEERIDAISIMINAFDK